MKKVLVLTILFVGIPALAATSLIDKMNEFNSKIDTKQAQTTQKVQAHQDALNAQKAQQEAKRLEAQKKLQEQKAQQEAQKAEAKKKLQDKKNAFWSLFTW